MSVTQEVLAATTTESALSALKVIGPSVLAVSALSAFVKNVREGEMGVRTRSGKATKKSGKPYGITGPGLKLAIPMLYSIEKVQTRPTTNEMPTTTFDVFDKNNKRRQMVADTFVRWSVLETDTNPYKALFKIKEGEIAQTVIDLCHEGFREAVESKSYEQLGEPEAKSAISAIVIENTKAALLEFGTELTHIGIKELRESDAEIGRQTGSIIANALDPTPLQPLAELVELGKQQPFPDDAA